MAHVRVGVRRFGEDEGVSRQVEVQQHWVEIDGHRIDSRSLVGVKYGLERDVWRPEAGGSGLANMVVVALLSSSFQTVSESEPELQANGHDHDEMLQHLCNEWGTLGVARKLLEPLTVVQKQQVIASLIESPRHEDGS